MVANVMPIRGIPRAILRTALRASNINSAISSFKSHHLMHAISQEKDITNCCESNHIGTRRRNWAH